MGVHDFDFIDGRWKIANRRLVDGAWIEFPARSEAQLILRGANTERFFSDELEGYTLRQYDPEADLWRIWWASTTRPGRLDPPMEGRFDEHGVGTFECDDTLDGEPIRVRFIWSEITADGGLWRQSFSWDGGSTWEFNWEMRLTRDTSPAG